MMKKLLLMVGLLIGSMSYGTAQKFPETTTEYAIQVFITELNGIELKREIADHFGGMAVMVEISEYNTRHTVVTIIQATINRFSDMKLAQNWSKAHGAYYCIVLVDGDLLTIFYFEDLSALTFIYDIEI